MGQDQNATISTNGRPTDFTAELGDEICSLIATSTKSLRRICEQNDHLPHAATIYRWLRIHEGFRDQYAQAREDQQDLMVEETIDIADDSRNDYIEEIDAKGNEKIVFNKEAVQRSKLRIEARQWQATKLNPKRYGNDSIKIQQLNREGKPTDPVTMSPDQVSAHVLAAMAAVQQAKEQDAQKNDAQ